MRVLRRDVTVRHRPEITLAALPVSRCPSEPSVTALYPEPAAPAHADVLDDIMKAKKIRIATDVRLIYRRGEGNTVEILSLIDREDLDRYIRQARTR